MLIITNPKSNQIILGQAQTHKLKFINMALININSNYNFSVDENYKNNYNNNYNEYNNNKETINYSSNIDEQRQINY